MSQVFAPRPAIHAGTIAAAYLAATQAELVERQRVFDAAQQRIKAKRPKIGRNESCWCGSGQKFKRCHYPNQ